jgi:hypothetical protein
LVIDFFFFDIPRSSNKIKNLCLGVLKLFIYFVLVYSLLYKNIGNYRGVINNLVLYGTGHDDSQLVFKNDHLLDSHYISIQDYLEKMPLVYTPMKDKLGNVAIEL